MWTRLCVDVGDGGNVEGISAERHDDDGRMIGMATFAHGPFDTVEEALAECRRRALDTYGDTMRLFD